MKLTPITPRPHSALCNGFVPPFGTPEYPMPPVKQAQR